MIWRRVRRSNDCFLGSICLLTASTFIWLYLNISPSVHSLSGYSSRDVSTDHAEISNHITDSVDDFKQTHEITTEVTLHGTSDLVIPGYIIANNSICAGDVDLLIYAQSKWEHFLHRRYIRRTWASDYINKRIKVKTVFILGRPADVNDQVKINNEQLLHGDIIEGDFIDSFQNLTFKSKIAMKWVQANCKHARYVLKVDDDMFVNIFAVIDTILPSMNHKHNVISCHLVKDGNSPIVRDKNSKWFIPSHIFPNRTHLPQFCSGYVVIMTSVLMRNLYIKSLTTPAVMVDDVYMFGQLTQEIKDITFMDLSKNLTLSQDKGLTAYKKGDTTIIAVNVQGSNAMEELWSLALMISASWTKTHPKGV